MKFKCIFHFFCPVFLFFAVITSLLSSSPLLFYCALLVSSHLPCFLILFFMCFFYSLYLTPLPFLFTPHLLVCPLFYIPPLLLAFPLIASSSLLPCALLVSSLTHFLSPSSLNSAHTFYHSRHPSLKMFLLCFKIWIMNDNFHRCSHRNTIKVSAGLKKDVRTLVK